jgi:hypothetical protein
MQWCREVAGLLTWLFYQLTYHIRYPVLETSYELSLERGLCKLSTILEMNIPHRQLQTAFGLEVTTAMIFGI